MGIISNFTIILENNR